jgi:hypothetical protein
MEMSEQTAGMRRTTQGFFSRVRLPITFGLVSVLVLGGYYFFFVQRKHSYLVGRNFRFLAAIGAQVESSLTSQARLLQSLAQKEGLAAAFEKPDEKARLLKEFGRGFEEAEIKGSPPPQSRIALRIEPEETWVDISHPLAGGKGHLQGSVKLRHVVEPLFHSRKAFDTLLLASSRGEVVYHQGVRDLSVKRLSSLLDKSGVFASARDERARDVADLLSSSSDSYSVELNGREYRLFIEPITLPLQGPSGTDRTWLVCGLVPRKELVYKSLAISSALLFSLLGLLLLALLSWPFLKLRLLGETQRVCLFDVLLLGICSLLGVSVATLFLLDLWVFGGLKEESSRQLEKLARALEDNATTEIQAAYQVLTALEDETLTAPWKGQDEPNLRAAYPWAFSGYPMANTFMLLRQDGLQVYKGSINAKVPPRISVLERSYFKRTRDGEVWDLRKLVAAADPLRPPVRSQDFVLESIVGWTSGDRSAVLSKPAGPVRHIHEKETHEIVAAALGIPMISLIDPVLPPGFKFAVVDNEDENGRVLFHSDSERNLTEDFLVETDYDRRLRSAIFARRAETMRIRYWGEDYIARVEPMRGLPWTVVALKDLQVLRAVNVDWLSTTLLFLVFYIGGLATLLVIVALARRSYRAEWIWPDPRRHQDYLALACSYGLALVGFLLAIRALQGSARLIAVACLVPALALTMAYARLGKSSHGREALSLGLGLALLAILAATLLQAPLELGVDRSWAVFAFLFLAAGFLTASEAIPFRGDWIPTLASRRRPLAEPAGDFREQEEIRPEASRDHGSADPGRRSISLAYCLCGTLLLLLTAALPTAGFFETAHRVHSESFLRHGQLKLAMELKRRALRVRREVGKAGAVAKAYLYDEWLALDSPRSTSCSPMKRGLDVYAGAFFETEPDLPPSAPAKKGHTLLCACMAGADSGSLPHFLESVLPRSSEHVVEMRELLHDNSSDCSWHWQRQDDGSLTLHSRDYPDSEIHLTSSPLEPPPGDPPASLAGALPVPWALLGTLRQASLPHFLLGLLSLSALLCLAVLVARFVARRIFLIDLLEPLWTEREETGPSTIGRNIFLVTRERSWREKEKVRERFFWLDLKELEDPEKGWPARRPALMEDPRVILVEGFEHRIGDDDFDTRKLDLLEDLAAMEDRTVIVVSSISPARLFSRKARPASRNRRRRSKLMSPTIAQRFRILLPSFLVREEDLRLRPEDSTRHVNSLLRELLRRALRRRQEQAAQAPPPIQEVLQAECGNNPYLKAIAQELNEQVRHLSREQILEEFGERAEGYYQTLWASCSLEEEVVLEHLAEEGFVNEKSRKLLRRLMARGIVRRTPCFQLMNETFRRFVISSRCKSEVLSIEKNAAPSAWDRLRGPFFLGMAASVAFFFATQEALLEGVVASVTGLTAGLPAIVKIFDFFGGDRSKLRLGGSR